MLTLIGLGLGDEKDISVKGLEAVKAADHAYLETYTSALGATKERLEEYYGKPLLEADRKLVEQDAEEILKRAATGDVAFLVVGDPFGATTHTDLVLRAKAAGIQVRVIHNASILNAVGEAGLELYRYGRTTSIPFPEEGYEPDSPYEAVKENLERGLHTLCLLDIKVAEPTREELRAGKAASRPPRHMSVHEALRILLAIEQRRGEHVISETMLAVGVARLGQPEQRILPGSIAELLEADFGGPLHCLIIPGRLHVVEEEAMQTFK